MSIKSEIRDIVYVMLENMDYYNSIINYPFDNSEFETLKFPACLFELTENNCENRNRVLNISITLDFELWIEITEALKENIYKSADAVDSALYTAVISSAGDRVNGLGKYIQKIERGNVEYLSPDHQFIVIKVSYPINFLTKYTDLTTNNLTT